MSEKLNPDSSELPPWLRLALEASQRTAQPGDVAPAPDPSITGLHETPAWNLLLDAALASSFLPRELAPGHLDGEARAQAERSVLDFADPIQYPDGVRWMLTAKARTQALEAGSVEEVAETARLATDRFADGVSAALRRYASMESPSVEQEDLSTLEAERTALSMLAGVPGLPSLEDLDRNVQLRRLLAGFERMTGASGSGKPDRVFGRDSDVGSLRNFVDVVPIGGLAANIGRAVRSVKRGLLGSPPFTIWGTGGVGKTTLMAKFMLEHAHAATDSYPFAYLDFDRSTVSARDPVGLLTEMCRQVGVQFRELSQALGELVSALGETARRLGAYSVAAGSAVREHQQRFRSIVDAYLERQESLFSRSRPILLVFDTFEVVQYSSEDLKALEVFVENFAHSDESRLWPRLRLVIAGRRPVEHFLGKVSQHPLGPLDESGATLMLVTLASDIRLTLGENDARRLVKALAKAGGNPKEGVHPLRLRLVGEVFRHSLDEAHRENRTLDGEVLVDSLIQDLSKADSEITGTLINGFLVRRILNHLIDDDVRALADPGLVVRLITPTVIRNVLARATAKPVKGQPDTSDNIDFAPWDLTPADADRIFAAFQKEVTLVDSDPPALRFRQDVRREMIPLIKSRRPNRFRRLHDEAWTYFSELADRNPADFSSAGEAVYHGLWAKDMALEKLDAYWRRDSAFQPRIDPEEFETGTLASLYLTAKMGGRLKPEEVKELGSSLAWEWLVGQSETLLQGSPMTEVAASVRAAVGDDLERVQADPVLAANVSRLLFRTGEWGDAAEVARQQLGTIRSSMIPPIAANPWVPPGPWTVTATSVLRTWLTIIAKCQTGEDITSFKEPINYVADPLVKAELICHVALATEPGFRIEAGLDEVVSRVESSRWLSEPRILRLVILAGKPNSGLLQNYFESLERLPRDEWLHYTLRDIIRDCYGEALSSDTERIHEQLMETDADDPNYFESLDRLFHADRQPLLKACENLEMLPGLISIVIADHSDWIWPLQFSLDRWFRTDPKSIDMILRRAETQLSRSQQKSFSKVTGGDVVSAALDAGKLLQLAEVLSKLESPRSLGGYPDDARGIADALLRWDRKLKAIYEPPPQTKHSSPRKPKRRK